MGSRFASRLFRDGLSEQVLAPMKGSGYVVVLLAGVVGVKLVLAPLDAIVERMGFAVIAGAWAESESFQK